MLTHEVDGLVFVTYETPLTPCGGIAAVMKYLPDALQRASGLRTVVLAPYHYHMPKLQQLSPGRELDLLGVVGHHDAETPVHMHLWRCQPDAMPGPCEWVYCLPDDAALFAGRKHPYDVETNEQSRGLVYDALLFGATLPRLLHLLGPGKRWAVLMQDWEGATAALAMAARPHKHSLYLTLHNSYDSGAVSDELLTRVGIDPTACQAGRPDGTVLERALRLVKRPVFTVSQGFAQDLKDDPFQRDVMAPHLQGLLQRGRSTSLIGIDNGPFAQLSIPEEVLTKGQRLSARSRQGIRPVRAWKRARRGVFCDALRGLLDGSEERSTRPMFSRVWGGIEAFLQRNEDDHEMAIPWFVMGGRDDSRQKGYDVAAQAARELLEAGEDACFLWFPIPGEERISGLQFLSELAWDFPDRVLVFPFVFREGYMAALQGATFALMPSFYEPFGAANEFYLQGTVGIGRATGGLVQQIVPLQEVEGKAWPGYSEAVARRTSQWHATDAPATGFLYREPDGIPSAITDWRGINEAHYRSDGGAPDRVAQRKQYGVWQAMVQVLRETLRDAAALYNEHPLIYDQMLLDGAAYIQARFSWEHAAILYLRMIAPHLVLDLRGSFELDAVGGMSGDQ